MFSKLFSYVTNINKSECGFWSCKLYLLLNMNLIANIIRYAHRFGLHLCLVQNNNYYYYYYYYYYY